MICPRFQGGWISLLFVCVAFACTSSDALLAQETLVVQEALAAQADETRINSVLDTAAALETASDAIDWIGIDGHYRVGEWTAVRVNDALQSSPVRSTDRLILETSDGDGVVAQYDQQFLRESTADSESRSSGTSLQSQFGYCVPGTEAAPLIIRARMESDGSNDSKNEDDFGGETPVLLKTRFPESGVPADGPSMIPLGMPWVVVLGDALGVDAIGANELLDRAASVAVTKVTDARSVPDHVLGLSGVDLILITGSGRELLEQLSPAQSLAISDWVHAGGRVMVTLGGTAKKTLQAAPWLAELLPESVAEGAVIRLDPSGIETFTSSQTRLSVFDGLRLPKITSLTGGRSSQIGETLIAGRSARRISLPLASRYVAGFGKVTVVAADLDQAPFAGWPERFDLVTKLLGDVIANDRGDASSSIRRSGYSDLSGQLRRSLDQFPIKRGLNFSVIALVIVSLIILVAPLDYFVVRRVFGNPLLGWLTFPIVAIFMSIGLVIAAQPQIEPPVANAVAEADLTAGTRASGLLRSNSMEVLDVDVATKTGRLFRWAFLYSHTAQQLDVNVGSREKLDAITASLGYQTMRPFGAPGVSMGGIQIDAWSDRMEVPVSNSEKEGIRSQLRSLQIAPLGSKSLACSMQFESNVTSDSVKRRGGSELLQGKLTNPLDTDLLDAMLVYQNWVYLLPTRFPAGATVEDVDRLRQKNFRWQLSRQRALESSSEGESWDVTRTDQPERLAEMLMFHDAVGGPRYTGLRHEVLGHLDMSQLLTDDRCLLVGRCRESWTSLDVTPTRQTSSPETPNSEALPVEPAGESSTWVRVLMPVEELRRY